MSAPPADQVLALSFVLFALGVVGVIVRRNVVVMLLSAELMLNAAILALVVFDAVHFGHPGAAGGAPRSGFGGEAFGVVAALAAVAQVGVGLAVVAAWLRRRSSLDVDDVSSLKW